jgi:DMSO/TMAO reductase YedYZ molybdopterin-dependent catalytic subunit
MRADKDDRPALALPVAGLVGVVAVLAALAAGHLVAAFVGPSASPYLAVGNTAIDLTPTPVKDWAVRVFGTADKLALLSGMALVLLVFALVAGLLSRRGSTPGAVLAAVLGLVGVAAVLARPDVGQLGVLAPLVSLGVGVAAFRWLHRVALRPVASAEPAGVSRRAFLVSTAGVVVGAGVAGAVGQAVAAGSDVEQSRRAVGTLTPSSPVTTPAGADFAADGTPTFLTANADFYRIDTALAVPRLRAEDWALRVHGMVDHELTLRYADLRDRDLVSEVVTLTCVSNEVGGPYISTAEFLGVPLRDVLLAAGVKPGADQLLSTSADGFTAGTPVDVVLEPDRGALLALGMNGEPLPVEHGFPVRMVVPGLYGYVSATKWLTDLELTTFDSRSAYWQQRGWAQRGPIKTESRIDVPRSHSRVSAGRVVVAGIAWAQPVGVAAVEVRVDNGPWQRAELATEVSGRAWRMWRTTFDLPAGGHTVESRATDHAGRTQTSDRAPVVPDGATGYPAVFFTTT